MERASRERSRRRGKRIRRRSLSPPERRICKKRGCFSQSTWGVEEVESNTPASTPDLPVTWASDTQLSPQLENPQIASRTSFTADEVLSLITSMQQKTDKNKIPHNNHLNVVPDFDPSNKAQSVDSWIRKVNECAIIYDWNQKQTVHFALQKLVGLAKKWFEALPSVNYNWDEWQKKLLKAFPKEQNYGRLLEEMLARTSRNNESLKEYFYDKLALLNRCEISGSKAVDCIIHGIFDKSIRNLAQALNFKEPEDLLLFLNSQLSSIDIFVKKRNEGTQIQDKNRLANSATHHSGDNVPLPLLRQRSLDL